jgi:hypothetical protein
MDCFNVTPFVREIFDYEAPVAFVWRRFATQEHARRVEDRTVNTVLDAAFCEQGGESRLVFVPGNPLLAVGGEHLNRGREQQLVAIGRITDGEEEESQVVAFSERGQLRGVVEPDVDKLTNSPGL